MLEAEVNTAGEEKLRDRVPAAGRKRLGVWRLKFLCTCMHLCCSFARPYAIHRDVACWHWRYSHWNHRYFDCLVALNVQDQARLPDF